MQNLKKQNKSWLSLLLGIALYFFFVYGVPKIEWYFFHLEDDLIIKIIALLYGFAVMGLFFFLFKTDKLISVRNKWSLLCNALVAVSILAFMYFVYLNRVVYNIIDVFGTSPLNIVMSALVALEAAVFEEYLVRGLLFGGFERLFKRSHVLLLASVLSSTVFGLMHLSNAPTAGLESTIQQVFYAAVLGLIFCVIRIRCNRIWPAVIVHFLLDFQPNVASDGPVAAAPWGALLKMFLPILITTIICLFFMDRDQRLIK